MTGHTIHVADKYAPYLPMGQMPMLSLSRAVNVYICRECGVAVLVPTVWSGPDPIDWHNKWHDKHPGGV